MSIIQACALFFDARVLPCRDPDLEQVLTGRTKLDFTPALPPAGQGGAAPQTIPSCGAVRVVTLSKTALVGTILRAGGPAVGPGGPHMLLKTSPQSIQA